MQRSMCRCHTLALAFQPDQDFPSCVKASSGIVGVTDIHRDPLEGIGTVPMRIVVPSTSVEVKNNLKRS